MEFWVDELKFLLIIWSLVVHQPRLGISADSDHGLHANSSRMTSEMIVFPGKSCQV